MKTSLAILTVVVCAIGACLLFLHPTVAATESQTVSATPLEQADSMSWYWEYDPSLRLRCSMPMHEGGVHSGCQLLR
jgi:hypothetical protein